MPISILSISCHVAQWLKMQVGNLSLVNLQFNFELCCEYVCEKTLYTKPNGAKHLHVMTAQSEQRLKSNHAFCWVIDSNLLYTGTKYFFNDDVLK